MWLSAVDIKNLRVIEHLSIEPSDGINLIVGQNGAGKTSVLEGIYLAGRGRSFRHTDSGPMIREGADSAVVVLHLLGTETGRKQVLGVRRESRLLECRLNGEEVRRRSELAEALPVQWIGSQPQLLLDLGPETRRRFLDMGVFHVEHQYLGLIAEYQRVLRQRNAAIRAGVKQEISIWDLPLERLSAELNALRETFVHRLMASVERILADWDQGFLLKYRFRPGWTGEAPLAEQLARRVETDMRLGYTGLGPHRAELALTVDGLPAEKILSRGQQKMLVLAMHLALFDTISATSSSKAPVILLDDLPSELDVGNRALVISALKRRSVQVFMTAIEPNALEMSAPTDRMFHVEQGALKSL